ncbi:MAG: response regulator [Pseudomonadota bacterium]
MTEKAKILIVDDSEVIRKITARIVEDLGLVALEAENAADGVEISRDEKPAAVLLDWDLPSLGALDFLRGAASLAEGDKPEIILCATENDPEQFALAKAAGAAHHILKPYEHESIQDKLSDIGLVAVRADAVRSIDAASAS